MIFLNSLSQQRELYGESGNRRYTIFDRIFKGALEKFRKDLKTLIALEAAVSKVPSNMIIKVTSEANKWKGKVRSKQ